LPEARGRRNQDAIRRRNKGSHARLPRQNLILPLLPLRLRC